MNETKKKKPGGVCHYGQCLGINVVDYYVVYTLHRLLNNTPGIF